MKRSSPTDAQTPLLAGDLAERTQSSVDSIAQALLALDPGSFSGASLGSGTAGIALFHTFYARHTGDDAHAARAQDLASRSAEGLESMDHPLGPGLFGGVAGVASMLHELGVDDDLLAPIDDAFLALTSSSPFADGYDLIAGVTGIALYAIRRRRSARARALLQQAIGRLVDLSVPSPEGITWIWDLAWTPEVVRGARSVGEIDLGVAHGVAGILPVLGAASVILEDPAVARLAYVAARDWLLAQQLGLESASYPGILAPGRLPEATRHAWCYGDVGIAAALYSASRWTGDRPLADHACAVAARATKRPLDDVGFLDAGLCHGTSGVAHVYHRLYQATGNLSFAAHARRLFEETLSVRSAGGAGIAGYCAYDARFSPPLRDKPGLLEGAAGIGLAQLAALRAEPVTWDDLFGIVLPSSCGTLAQRDPADPVLARPEPGDSTWHPSGA